MIIVDSNEPNKMVRLLKKRVDYIKRKKLQHGEDYLVKYGEIKLPFQRKTAGDFCQSIADGRLTNQLSKLSTNYYLSVLVIEGYVSYTLSQTNFSRNAYLSSLASAFLKRSPEGKRGQIVILPAETEYDTAKLISFTHETIVGGKFERLPHIPGRKSDPLRAKLALLQMIPQIGEVRAEKIHEAIGSLKNLFETDKEELQKILGNKIGSNVYKFLREV